MEIFVLILVIIALVAARLLRNRIIDLEDNQETLFKRIKYLESLNNVESIKPLEKETELKVTRVAVPPPVYKEVLSSPVIKKDVKNKVIKSNKPPKEKGILLNKFLENGTGIIGVLVLVMGLAFLGIYSAINMSAFPRFLMFCLFSLVLFGGSYILEKKMKWNRLSLWLRSAAGAIFLFSCIGSTGIPGLVWIDNQISGLMLIIAGILLNIVLGGISKKEVVSSTHLFLSLVALAIAPPTMSILIVAGVITIYGIYLTYRKKWDINLVIIISMFAIFHTYWHYRLIDLGTDLSISQSAVSLSLIVLITLATLFSHYRTIYSVEKFESLPFFTHFLNWCYLAVGIYLYNSIIPFEFFMFSGGSILALVIANRATKLNIGWLKVTDTLVANLLMILAVLSLYPKGINLFYISEILFLESIIFLIVMCFQKQKLLSKIAYILVFLFSIIIFISNWSDDVDFKTPLLVITILGFGTLYYLKSSKPSFFKTIDLKYRSILSIMYPLYAFSIFTNHIESMWITALFVGVMAPVLIFRNILKNDIVYRFSKIVIVLVSLTSIIVIADNSVSFGTIYAIPLLVGLILLTILSYSYKKECYKNRFLIVFTGLTYVAITYVIFSQISEFLPGVIWLVSILGNLLLSSFLVNRKPNLKFLANVNKYLYVLSYIIFAIYVLVNIFVYLDIDSTIGIFKTRYLLEALAIGILVYWIQSKGTKIKGFVLEIALLFIILAIVTEVNYKERSLVLIIIAIASLMLNKIKGNNSRLRFYSVVLSWISAVFIATTSLSNHNWFSSITAIVIFCIYLVMLNRYGKLDKVRFPKYLSSLGHLSTKVHHKINLWVFYPFFISVALYIYFTFNQNIITLCFVLLSLIIFILSIALKEENFKIISLLGLGASLVRMIFVDLSNSGTITRALVFIGVGLVMVFMNIIYVKFNRNDSLE
ncbi:MAG: DUF2339 domain-containing protein [Spirochaetaceae bacterium]